MQTRRGMSLLEVAVSGVLLVALLTVSVQLLKATVAQRRAIGDRRTAIQQASNLMERLSAYPWDKLTGENVAALQLSSDARGRLVDSRLEIDVARLAGEPESKRITVVVHWRNLAGQPEQAVRLVAWRYRVEDHDD